MNYSAGYIPSGPNYSAITPGTYNNMRWVMFSFPVVNISNLTLTFGNTIGFDSIILTNFALYVKVEGSTGWINGNAPYAGIGSPVSDGSPALVVGSSTLTSKHITFGIGVYSGILFARVGIPSGNTRAFTSLVIS